MPSGRRVWPWAVLAVLASAAPWVLLSSTEDGGLAYLPLVSVSSAFLGVAARSLLPLDIAMTGGLPLLVMVAAAGRWRILAPPQLCFWAS